MRSGIILAVWGAIGTERDTMFAGFIAIGPCVPVRHLRVAIFFFFSSRRRHTRFDCDWSSDVCSSDLQKTKDPQVRQQLVELFNNLVVFLAKKFSNRGEPLEDIVQVGYIGLLQAIERFEPQRGLEFSTFATPTIVGEIKRYFRDKRWAVKVPRRLQETKQRADVAQQRLQGRPGRQPSVNEIAKELGLQPEEVLEAMEASPAQRTIPFESTGPAARDDDGLQLTERLGLEDENLDKVELQDLLDQAMRHLTPRERRIMYLRFVDELPQAGGRSAEG